ncbi:RES family NAD+ phosphorylase [Aquimarina sp. ERC-38]|uniref:RES family NAD+ phosphorylase n=1 Tax=Aquimarina sp. ERC-38 TaxID=2949996 RepID=UPI002247DEB3|nr:RES family NAD+ phosphorylase [Aquimarina sp. ERC-38]UZO82497.1 RES family NAD+ phosphorylase [Aquimarina sp. ERC-38]
MIVYRLSKGAYKNDLSGFGAEKYGGRWNNRGTRMIYTAQSRALANLEVAVHVPLNMLPRNYYMVSIKIPDASIQVFNTDHLDDPIWRLHPPSEITQTTGDQFIATNDKLVLKVPSAIVPGDFNYLINPVHRDISKIKIIDTTLFDFDQRLFRL